MRSGGDDDRRLRYGSHMPQDRSLAAAAERLRLTLELFDEAVAMLRLKLRRLRPLASDEEIEAGVDAWIAKRPGAEDGDYVEVAPPSSS